MKKQSGENQLAERYPAYTFGDLTVDRGLAKLWRDRGCFRYYQLEYVGPIWHQDYRVLNGVPLWSGRSFWITFYFSHLDERFRMHVGCRDRWCMGEVVQTQLYLIDIDEDAEEGNAPG